MKKLIEEQIKKINDKCPYNQGIFKEPFGVPDTLKELLIYTRWKSGGCPGSCFDDENTINEPYLEDRPDNSFKVLDLTLEELKIKISSEDYQKILSFKQNNTEIDYGYYGDYTEETIEWIKLSDLYKILKII